jgi:predicted RNA binding protein YcfA (HicA-like mRNA interferase family)
MPVKVHEVLTLLEADGWYLVATRGSHRQYKHPSKRGRVTVAGKPSDDLHPKTLASIFKQAQWKE